MWSHGIGREVEKERTSTLQKSHSLAEVVVVFLCWWGLQSPYSDGVNEQDRE